MAYLPNDQELEALARLSRSPEWAQVTSMLSREHSVQVDIHGSASEMPAIFRAQGAATALRDLLELVKQAPRIFELKRDRHTNPATRTPAQAGAWN